MSPPSGACRRRSASPSGCWSGLALGCLNAALIYYLRVTSIIITIATMSVYFALLMWVTGGKSIYALPDWWSTRIVLFQTETADGDLVRDHPADPGGGAGGPAHLAADDPHLRRPPAHRHGRQSRGGAPARHRHRRHAFPGLRLSRPDGRPRRPAAGAPRRRGRAQRHVRQRAQRAGRGRAGRRQPDRRHRHRGRRAAGHPAAGHAAERAEPAGRLALLLPDRDRPGDPGLDLDHRPVGAGPPARPRGR